MEYGEARTDALVTQKVRKEAGWRRILLVALGGERETYVQFAQRSEGIVGQKVGEGGGEGGAVGGGGVWRGADFGDLRG